MAMRSRDEAKAQPVTVFSGRHDRRKVTDWVYEELKSAIVDLRLSPGDPLREATLAEQLGVSKTPIREALTRLEQEGLVETTSFKGAVVSGYSRPDPRADREPAGPPDPDRPADRGDPRPDRGLGRRAREDPRSDRRPRP